MVGADGSLLGNLIDAYSNTLSGKVEQLIVDASVVGGKVRLIDVDKVREYDTTTRRLTVELTASDPVELAPAGIPVMLLKAGDPAGAQLHVVSKVIGLMVEATDGLAGQAADILVDSDGWAIRYLVVDTRDWLPGSDKLVPIEWVESVDWIRGRMFLKISQARAKTCQRASAGSHLLDRV
mgnify:CR=1 FL=1